MSAGLVCVLGEVRICGTHSPGAQGSKCPEKAPPEPDPGTRVPAHREMGLHGHTPQPSEELGGAPGVTLPGPPLGPLVLRGCRGQGSLCPTPPAWATTSSLSQPQGSGAFPIFGDGGVAVTHPPPSWKKTQDACHTGPVRAEMSEQLALTRPSNGTEQLGEPAGVGGSAWRVGPEPLPHWSIRGTQDNWSFGSETFRKRREEEAMSTLPLPQPQNPPHPAWPPAVTCLAPFPGPSPARPPRPNGHPLLLQADLPPASFLSSLPTRLTPRRGVGYGWQKAGLLAQCWHSTFGGCGRGDPDSAPVPSPWGGGAPRPTGIWDWCSWASGKAPHTFPKGVCPRVPPAGDCSGAAGWGTLSQHGREGTSRVWSDPDPHEGGRAGLQGLQRLRGLGWGVPSRRGEPGGQKALWD